MRYIASMYLLFAYACIGWSQSNNSVYLHNLEGATSSLLKSGNSFAWPDNNCDEGGCYALLQFDELDVEHQRAALLRIGIELFDYIPDRAFLARKADASFIELPDFVTQVVALNGSNKRPFVLRPQAGGPENEPIYHLVVLPFPGVNAVMLANALDQLGARINGIDEKSVNCEVSAEQLTQVLACPLLKYAESVAPEATPDGQFGRQNANLPYRQNVGLNRLSGAGVSIGVADDGRIDHLDFQGRLVDHTIYNSGRHGDMVAGMLAGGGLLDPRATGAAPGATIHLFDISKYDHILDAVSNYYNYDIALTSTSYGEGCGEPYNIYTRDIDAQVYQLKQLFHGFSAGNHAVNPCFNQYGFLGTTPEGRYLGTITGGRKTGKNVFTFGNVDALGRVVVSSSMGPTVSGRIKPDAVILGQGDVSTGPSNTYMTSSGTSAAAPNGVGVAANLYELYQNLHQGQKPTSALIKAVMINGADDIEQPGPDYSSGWGQINAKNAVEMLEQEHYWQSSLMHNQQQALAINVPEGTQRLKVSLVWHDAPGSVLAARDLVNDLDLELITPTGSVQLPWTLASDGSIGDLLEVAQAGRDRVNNVEQVVIDRPVSGQYTVVVKGYQVPTGAQDFALVYHLENEELAINWPTAGTNLLPNEEAIVAWEAIDNEGTFSLEYSINGGNNWILLANNVPGNARHWLWQVPSITTTRLQVRVRRQQQAATSAGHAIIAPTPSFSVLSTADGQARVQWSPVAGAIAYEVYRLGDTAMEPLGQVGQLEFIAATPDEENWYSVAAVFPGGVKGARAIAKSIRVSACDRHMSLRLRFDAHPEQTSWQLLDSYGSIVHSGGPYVGQPAFSTLQLNFCLPAACYTLIMRDSEGDGMCCQNGVGTYALLSGQGEELASGSAFDQIAYHLVCPPPGGAPTLNAQLVNIKGITCFGSADGALKVEANGGSGNYSYHWNTGQQSEQIVSLDAGQYTVTVSDGEQEVILSTNLTSPNALALQADISPSLCSDGQIMLAPTGGIGPYHIQWENGQQVVSRNSLPADDYYIALTDANGCFMAQRFEVGQLPAVQVNLLKTDPSCDVTDGTIEAHITGGRGNYQLQWSNGRSGVNALQNLDEGLYSVSVSDNNCLYIANTTLTSPSSFSLVAETRDPSCASSTDGSIELMTSAHDSPVSFQWSTGATASFVTGVGAGIYGVTATDENACEQSLVLSLNEPDPLAINITTQAANPYAGGTASVEVSGGMTPYTFQWSHLPLDQQNQTPTQNDLNAGTYLITVIDSKGCSVQASADVNFNDGTSLPNYCTVTGIRTNYEWIEQVSINDQTFNTGNNGGYLTDEASADVYMTIGAPQQFNLLPGYASTIYNESWVIWIDFNLDGDFTDEGETLLRSVPTRGLFSTSLMLPEGLTPGARRMRIAMQYASPAPLCGNVIYGEIEDYTVVLQLPEQELLHQDNWYKSNTPASILTEDIRIFPNPFVAGRYEYIQVELPALGAVDYVLSDSKGRQYQYGAWDTTKGKNYQLSIDDLPAGIYFLRLTNAREQYTKRIIIQ